MPDDAAVQEAVDALRQAMLDRGDHPETVEAQLGAVIPNQPSVVGNLADLMRSPAPPAEDADYSDWTKADLQAELDAQGIEYGSGETKADLLARLS
jgi:hypothetical protein